jgi:Ran GTPase-activating protein (RanGAP) involved in mRNA processing and transport
MSKLKFGQKQSAGGFAAEFDMIVDRDRDMLEIVSKQFEESIRFFDTCKIGYEPATLERYRDDPGFAYFWQCERDHELVLPVLKYIDNKTLCLMSYTLSIGHCKALAKACQFLDRLKVNKIVFDNCGIDDEEFATILKGLQKLNDFKKIIYRYNVFDQLSLEGISPILQKGIPNHLEELRIENCNIPGDVARELISCINQKSYLKCLSLVNVNLNDDAFGGIIEFVKESNLLEEIDISWSNLRSSSIASFLEILKSNRKLEYINLSWNKLIDPSEINKPDHAEFVVNCICT